MRRNKFTTGKEKAQKKERKKKRRVRVNKKHSESVSQIMNGDFLTKDFVLNNLNYIFFLIFLMVLLVSKGYYVNQLTQNITVEERKIREINADYVETKAKLEEVTRREELIKRLKEAGLKETTNPVKVIRVKEEDNNK